LIVVTNKPRWLWWRDSALTLAMWLLFAGMLESEFGLFFGRYLDQWGSDSIRSRTGIGFSVCWSRTSGSSLCCLVFWLRRLLPPFTAPISQCAVPRLPL